MISWTEEVDAALKAALVAGLSRSQIATQLGTTRCAVSGRVFRLGIADLLPHRIPRPTRQQPPRAPKTRRPRLVWSSRGVAAVAPAEPVASLMIPILELQSHHCRWPTGVDENGTPCFCGAEKFYMSWCVGHHAMGRVGNARRAA